METESGSAAVRQVPFEYVMAVIDAHKGGEHSRVVEIARMGLGWPETPFTEEEIIALGVVAPYRAAILGALGMYYVNSTLELLSQKGRILQKAISIEEALAIMEYTYGNPYFHGLIPDETGDDGGITLGAEAMARYDRGKLLMIAGGLFLSGRSSILNERALSEVGILSERYCGHRVYNPISRKEILLGELGVGAMDNRDGRASMSLLSSLHAIVGTKRLQQLYDKLTTQ